MKNKFAIILIPILFFTAGCQTIQKKTDEVVEKENQKYGAGEKCATKTPDEASDKEFNLKILIKVIFRIFFILIVFI